MTRPERPRWHYIGGVVRDRELWTGTDDYDPFGWGNKRGRWMSTPSYFRIWNRACGER